MAGNAVNRHFDVTERRRRLLARHRLAVPGQRVEDIAGELVGLHATDPATVYLSLQQRLADFTPADLDEALYERRSLTRLLGMRRTMFVVPLDLAAVVEASCTRALIVPERRRTVQLIEAEGIAAADAFVDDACAAVLAVLDDGPPLPGRALTPLVAQLQQHVLLAEGKPYEARVSLTNRILLQLSIEGHIVRTKPLGSWRSSQYRWTTVERWFVASGSPIPSDAARVELVRRWLRTYGPGTTDDIAWWAKWPKKVVADVLHQLGAVAVTVEPAPGGSSTPAWLLPDDLDDDLDRRRPVVSLLPSLDPSIMGWKEREWILDGLGTQLFDRNGNAGPIVLVDGAAVGVWAQLVDGRVVT
ncbi:MAG TPA: winged helix DNA-binding domain-containing protein, partial [Desertimonas sp.]|nr:winged helix DNA-binding domain-containing protein [Desertimonas sp.]